MGSGTRSGSGLNEVRLLRMAGRRDIGLTGQSAFEPIKRRKIDIASEAFEPIKRRKIDIASEAIRLTALLNQENLAIIDAIGAIQTQVADITKAICGKRSAPRGKPSWHGECLTEAKTKSARLDGAPQHDHLNSSAPGPSHAAQRASKVLDSPFCLRADHPDLCRPANPEAWSQGCTGLVCGAPHALSVVPHASSAATGQGASGRRDPHAGWAGLFAGRPARGRGGGDDVNGGEGGECPGQGIGCDYEDSA